MFHCVKSVQILSFFCFTFSWFGPEKTLYLDYFHAVFDIIGRPVEMKKVLGGLPIMKYYRPPWLADKENFSFQIV